MDDQTTEAPGAAPADATPAGDVEAVLATMQGLDEQPVGEHVAVFERAHESLRRVLAGVGSRG